jgi:nucleotide-binding universal stress UspA family protein
MHEKSVHGRNLIRLDFAVRKLTWIKASASPAIRLKPLSFFLAADRNPAMTVNTVLVHVEPGSVSESRLKYAISLAKTFGARLTGLTVTLPPTEISFAMMGDAQLFAAAVEAAEESASIAKIQFDRLTVDCGLPAIWRDGNGNPEDVIAAEAGCADIVVLGRPDRHDLDGSFYTLSPANVLMACGRPILIVPAQSPETFQAKRIVLAWKNTPEAARAAHDALPFLVRAEEVMLTEIIEPANRSDRYTISIEDMAGHLRAHGVNIMIHKIRGDGADVGALLVRAGAEGKADLIVAGAYGHSRLREWMLGGVTMSLLNTATGPCLFSH